MLGTSPALICARLVFLNLDQKPMLFEPFFCLLNGSRQTLVLIRYYELERLPTIISLNPPLIRLHSFLVRKVLLLLVTTLQEYLHFKAK